jgi:hypothetical protein
MKLASFFQIPASAPGAANFGFVFSTPALAFRPLPIGFVFSKPTSPTSNPQNSPYLRFRSAILAFEAYFATRRNWVRFFQIPIHPLHPFQNSPSLRFRFAKLASKLISPPKLGSFFQSPAAKPHVRQVWLPSLLPITEIFVDQIWSGLLA